MSVIVRKYVESDYERVNEIINQAFGFSKANCMEDSIEEYVAVMDNVVAGYFQVFLEHDIIQDFYIWHIGYVCVDAAYRGMGIGKKMMEEVVLLAKEKKIRRLELTSGNQREAAHRLYSSMGFEKRDSSIFRKEIL